MTHNHLRHKEAVLVVDFEFPEHPFERPRLCDPPTLCSSPSQVSFSEGGPGSNSTGSEVASMSSQLPDTPNSMVSSPIEAWADSVTLWRQSWNISHVTNHGASQAHRRRNAGAPGDTFLPKPPFWRETRRWTGSRDGLALAVRSVPLKHLDQVQPRAQRRLGLCVHQCLFELFFSKDVYSFALEEHVPFGLVQQDLWLFIIYCQRICHILCNFLKWSKRKKKSLRFGLWLFSHTLFRWRLYQRSWLRTCYQTIGWCTFSFQTHAKIRWVFFLWRQTSVG